MGGGNGVEANRHAAASHIARTERDTHTHTHTHGYRHTDTHTPHPLYFSKHGERVRCRLCARLAPCEKWCCTLSLPLQSSPHPQTRRCPRPLHSSCSAWQRGARQRLSSPPVWTAVRRGPAATRQSPGESAPDTARASGGQVAATVGSSWLQRGWRVCCVVCVVCGCCVCCVCVCVCVCVLCVRVCVVCACVLRVACALRVVCVHVHVCVLSLCFFLPASLPASVPVCWPVPTHIEIDAARVVAEGFERPRQAQVIKRSRVRLNHCNPQMRARAVCVCLLICRTLTHTHTCTHARTHARKHTLSASLSVMYTHIHLHTPPHQPVCSGVTKRRYPTIP